MFKAAFFAGVAYAKERNTACCIIEILVHEAIISLLPQVQVGDQTLRDRLAVRYAHPVPKAHPLLD